MDDLYSWISSYLDPNYRDMRSYYNSKRSAYVSWRFRSFRIILFTLLALLSIFTFFIAWYLLSATSTYSLPTISEKILNSLEERNIRSHLEYLSSDLLEGRGTGTRGESLAVSYIQSHMNQAGLETMQQEVPMVGLTPEYTNPFILIFTSTDTSSPLELAYKDDFILNTDTVTQQIDTTVNELVFVGFGIYAPEYGWDDYKNINVQGKVLLAFVSEPTASEDEPGLFKGNQLTYYGRWMYKYEEARRRKARAMILIHTEKTAGYPFSVLSNQIEQIRLRDAPNNPLEWKMWLSQSSAERFASMYHLSIENLFDSCQKRNFQPKRIPIRMSFHLQFQLRFFSGTNIIGILAGKSHANECVVISTHHDHLGINKETQGDSIYNGAEDNASGVSALLASITLFSSMEPLDRSICFLSLTAEEYGLLGAFYYAEHPVMEMIADINFDIMNVYGKTRDIVGLGAEMSQLNYLFEDAVSKEGMYVSQDPNPASGSFFRSDTFAFARIGIPSIYIWTGFDFVDQPPNYFQKMRDSYIKERYHQPSDEYDSSWSMSGVMQQLRVAIRICYGVANSRLRPMFFKDQNGGFLPDPR